MADETSFLAPLLRELVYGIDAWKKPVKVVATGNITQSGLQTVDGVALAAADEVLCVGQSNPAQNGVFVAATGTWLRRPDASNSERLFEGVRVPVTRGTHAGDVYRLATTGKINVGTTAQTWQLDAQENGGGEGVVDPDPNTIPLRGAAGELKAEWFDVPGGRLRSGTPEQAGDLSFRSNGRPRVYSQALGAPDDVLLRSDVFREYRHIWPEDTGALDEGTVILAMPANVPLVLRRCMVFPEGDITEDLGANYAELHLESSDGSTLTSLASISTDEVAVPQYEFFTMPASGSSVAAGDRLQFTVYKRGTGKLLPKFTFLAEFMVDPAFSG